MSYSELAQLELMDALNNISTEAELNEFKDMVALFFAQKAQKAQKVHKWTDSWDINYVSCITYDAYAIWMSGNQFWIINR